MTHHPNDASLEQRIARLEDQFAIYQLVSAYGPAADSCNMADIESIWAEDGVYEIGGLGVFQGHGGIKAALEGEFHRSIVNSGSAHASTFPHVVVDGTLATATHYGTLYAHRNGEFACIRLVASRWQFEKSPRDGWKIKRRTNILLDGDPAAPALLARATQDPPR